MKLHRFIITLGMLLGGMTAGQATELGFGQLGGSNTTVPGNYGSHATADGNGYVVSLGGATPNIGLTWDANWDIHTSGFFTDLENQSIGGGAWDNEGDIPRIGQLDFGTHTIGFSADPDFALVLNSFDFGHTAETAGTTEWSLTLTAVSSSSIVWDESVTFVNGQVFTLTPDFTGDFGESYLLTFTRTSETYGSNGRHGIDNLNFSQIAVPEPSTVALLGVAGLAVLVVARRRK
ncbi:MAG: PEP-CTERM sorting domain-containing protein [Verrucomicrobiae bacterium]|nr:PEP-CTERM sorting domain-containing protein [Verrucomicrobiae bacterium]